MKRTPFNTTPSFSCRKNIHKQNHSYKLRERFHSFISSSSKEDLTSEGGVAPSFCCNLSPLLHIFHLHNTFNEESSHVAFKSWLSLSLLLWFKSIKRRTLYTWREFKIPISEVGSPLSSQILTQKDTSIVSSINLNLSLICKKLPLPFRFGNLSHISSFITWDLYFQIDTWSENLLSIQTDLWSELT